MLGEPIDWSINFGRSPECRSYDQALSGTPYTFSNCGSRNTVFDAPTTWDQADISDLSAFTTQLPAGFYRQLNMEGYTDTCCGACMLDFPEFRLYYFPDQNFTDCLYNQTSNPTSALTAGKLRKRLQSLIADGSTAVVGEHTLYV